jgi:ubiquinone/menaquinone biosynthesis C-methylase UbiE
MLLQKTLEKTQSRMNDLTEHYDTLADIYDYLYPPVPKLAQVVSSIIANLSTKHHFAVVELGAGTALLLRTVEIDFADSEYLFIALDLSSQMCRSGLQHIRNYIQADFSYLPFADKSVNLFVFKESLHHSPNKTQLQSELLRVLKVDGKIVAIVQADWYLEPTNIIADYVTLARSERRSPNEMIESLLGNKLGIEAVNYVKSTNKVDSKYPSLAIRYALLSYWRTIELKERERLGDELTTQLHNTPIDIELKREFHLFTLARL